MSEHAVSMINADQYRSMPDQICGIDTNDMLRGTGPMPKFAIFVYIYSFVPAFKGIYVELIRFDLKLKCLYCIN